MDVVRAQILTVKRKREKQKSCFKSTNLPLGWAKAFLKLMSAIFCPCVDMKFGGKAESQRHFVPSKQLLFLALDCLNFLFCTKTESENRITLSIKKKNYSYHAENVFSRRFIINTTDNILEMSKKDRYLWVSIPKKEPFFLYQKAYLGESTSTC